LNIIKRSDICFYDNLTETITAVEIFKPKADTFDVGVEYALCLATNSSVILLSIDFIKYNKGNGAEVDEMGFSEQPIYTIPTDNVIINTIKASNSTGRLFLGAKDGCLYEFVYQNQTSWLSSQTKKVNLSHNKLYYFIPSIFNFNDADSIVQIELDESRNILYTRSENSTIQVFYLGANGLEASKINYLTCSTIAGKAASLISSTDKHFFMPIVHLAAISRRESKNINLVATTHFGVRLYFSLNHFESQHNMAINQTAAGSSQGSNQGAPSTFQLVHVRIPPNIELSNQNRTGPISSAYLHDGIDLMVSKRNEQTDSVLLMNHDLFLLHNAFKESKSIFEIDGRIWCIDEILPGIKNVRSGAQENDLLQTVKSASGVEDLPKLTSEFFDLPRRFAMLTPQGCFLWNKLRPMDQLCHVLIENNGPNSEGVRLFFNKIYERSEACALCLAVTLSHYTDPDSRISEWASQAFFIYSGEPEIRKRGGCSYSAPINNNFKIQSSDSHHFMNTQHPTVLNGQMTHDGTLLDQHEHSLYGDITQLPPYRQQQQQQQQQSNLNRTYILNSPQQMSTPINNRIKQEQYNNNTTFQHQFVPPQNDFTRQYNNNNTQIPLQDTLNMKQPGEVQNECEIFFSGKHDAVFIYLSRLLAPIWQLNILTELSDSCPQLKSDSVKAIMEDEQLLVFASFTDVNIQWYLNKLNELKRFMDNSFPHINNPAIPTNNAFINVLISSYSTSPIDTLTNNLQNHTTSSARFSNLPINMATLVNLTNNSNSNNSMNGGKLAGPHQQQLQQQKQMMNEDKMAVELENSSICLYKKFLNHIIEMFGLWKILDDHKFHFISKKLDKPTQLQLLNMTVQQFVLISDTSFVEKLITALLYGYIDDDACTDLLNQRLKQMCPSLYTNDNAIFSKACEKLKQALNAQTKYQDTYERDRLLKEAVDLMKQIGYVANLTQVCDMLHSAGCYEAIFELCLTAAEKRDPKNIALDYYRKSEPLDDVQGQSFYNLRNECYNYMLDCLTTIMKTPNVNVSNQSGIQQQQQYNSNYRTLLTSKEKVEDQLNLLIKYIITCKDELAHVSLFNWMIQFGCGLEKKLVTLDSQYLEAFLIREIKENTKNRIYLDLLWRFYDYKKDYTNAAKVLTALAEKYSECPISLKERVEYLTQAIVALNSTHKSAAKDEITELNDKKDVALLQEKIYREISMTDQQATLKEEALQQLDSQLFDITKVTSFFKIFFCFFLISLYVIQI
jgi:hypothetical protein